MFVVDEFGKIQLEHIEEDFLKLEKEQGISDWRNNVRAKIGLHRQNIENFTFSEILILLT